MNRVELVQKLEKVSPALSSNDILPILTHFWFTGKEVIGYNGNVAITTPLATEFDACVPGAALLNVMKAAGAKEVTFDLTEKELKIRAAKARMSLVVMPPDQFAEMCNIPDPPDKVLECSAQLFLAGIETCLRSISGDTSIPDQLGVTIIPGEKGVFLYSTNHKTFSRAYVPFHGPVPFKSRAIFSALFCKQLLQLALPKKKMKMRIDKDSAIFAGGGAILFGALVDSPKPIRYHEIFGQHYDNARDGKLVPIPSKLVKILERACVYHEGDGSGVQTHIKVKAGLATFYTESRLGKITDELQLVKGHPDCELSVDARHVRAGCADFDRMLITERSFIMANQTAFYLIAGTD